MSYGCLAALMAMALLSGCTSASVVRQTAAGGELALRGNRHEAMPKARKIMAKHCRGPYTIVEQGEVALSRDGKKTEWRLRYVCSPGQGSTREPRDL